MSVTLHCAACADRRGVLVRATHYVTVRSSFRIEVEGADEPAQTTSYHHSLFLCTGCMHEAANDGVVVDCERAAHEYADECPCGLCALATEISDLHCAAKQLPSDA